MKKNNLTIKTLVYLAIFSIAILLLLWIIQIQFLQVFYEKYQIDNITKVASYIEEDTDSLPASLEDYAYKYDMCIQYYTLDGTIGYNLKNTGCLLGSSNYQIAKYKSHLLTSDKKYIKLYAPNTGTKSIIYLINLGEGNYIFLNTTLEDLNTTTSLLKNQLIYIILMLIVLSIIMSIFISKRINKPIIKIIEKAKELGRGNYNVVFDKSNIAELDELSEVLTVAASEMNKTEELRRDLLANVSHDLKTPLTMIKAYAEKVRDLSYKDDEKREKDLNIIIEESDRLNVLVNDLLDLSKLEAHAEELNITRYDLVADINAILKRYDIIKETENYKFIVDMPSKAYVLADQSKIDQVIYNLINNAIEHTGEDLTVKITVKKQKDTYLVEITDSGKGISEADKALVWNKYYKKEKNHKRNVVGSGIGLSIVKEVLEHHKFEYGIDSKLNEYTTFYFKIKKTR